MYISHLQFLCWYSFGNIFCCITCCSILMSQLIWNDKFWCTRKRNVSYQSIAVVNQRVTWIQEWASTATPKHSTDSLER
jgi:hypothetical protein